PAEIIDHVPSGRLYLDGTVLIAANDGTVQARRKLGFAGHVVALVVFDRKGKLASARVVAEGLPRGGEEAEIEERIIDDMEEELSLAVDAMPKNAARDDDAVEEVARKALRSVLREAWGKKPLLAVEIVRLEE